MQTQPQSQEPNKLALLQYNVNKSRKKVIIGLLQDLRTAKYNILAIQEPWRNRTSNEGYNPRSSPFHLLQKPSETTKTAIYINKRIPLRAWDEIYKDKNLITIRLRTKTQ